MITEILTWKPMKMKKNSESCRKLKSRLVSEGRKMLGGYSSPMETKLGNRFPKVPKKTLETTPMYIGWFPVSKHPVDGKENKDSDDSKDSI